VLNTFNDLDSLSIKKKRGPTNDSEAELPGVALNELHKDQKPVGGITPTNDDDVVSVSKEATSADTNKYLQSRSFHDKGSFFLKLKNLLCEIYEENSATKMKRAASIAGYKVRSSGLVQARGFIDVLEMASEYLNMTSSESNVFTARKYSKYFLRFAAILIPLYLIIWIFDFWIRLGTCHTNFHRGFTGANHTCNLRNFYAVAYLGNTVKFLALFLALNILASVVSVLIYSSDVAHALTKYWLHRFHFLRRIANSESLEKDKDPADADSTAAIKRQDSHVRASFSLSNHAELPESVEEDSLVHVQCLLERDAYERYLFTHAYFKEATGRWTVFLTITLVCTFLLALQSYLTIVYIYTFESYIDINYVTVCVVNVVFFSVIGASLAYANSAVEHIKEGFLYCGANDYSLIGGREAWLEYVDKAPIYWYVFGVAIKQSDFAAFVGGLASAAIAAWFMSIVASG
jgi:hypothetical protein